MAQTYPSIWYDAYVYINSVDLSDFAFSVAFPYGAKMLARDTFGVTTERFMPGLITWSVTVQFFQTFEAAKVYATIYPLIGPAVAAFPIAIRPNKTDAIGATNPEFQMNAHCESMPIIDGGHGESATVPAVFRSAGAITVDTTP